LVHACNRMPDTDGSSQLALAHAEALPTT
jgi:hypothetical protein